MDDQPFCWFTRHIDRQGALLLALKLGQPIFEFADSDPEENDEEVMEETTNKDVDEQR